ncbi:MAG: N-acetylmuramoyl-L-alanine amidase [candidate division NC10 bacterium]|nr:N-acetylmuramoyl-L-alanine amidase [candidate division NC10 bacterium]
MAINSRLIGLLAPLLFSLLLVGPASGGTSEFILHLEERKVVLSIYSLGQAEYLPMTQVVEALEGRFIWNKKEKQISLTFAGTSLVLKEGERQLLVGDKAFRLRHPPQVVEGRPLVPLEFLKLALVAKYGEGQITWESRAARVSPAPLRLLRYRSYPDYTRIVLEMTFPLGFSVSEADPRRLILEVKGGRFSPGIQRQEVGDGLVKTIEPKQEPDRAVLYVAIEGKRGPIKTFLLKDPDRIVIDIHRSPDVSAKAAETSPKGTSSRPPPALQPGKDAPSFTSKGLRTIVIDPGHGGKDSGAVGSSGLKEKDVVLDIGLRLKRLIEERLPAKVVMTRSEDVFVPLEERTSMANQTKADFFISIHVNAAPRSRAVGFETFFLSKEPSDNDARASALRENMVVSLEGVSPKEMASLHAILWDLAQTMYIQESSELAEMVQEELDKILKVENRGIKTAPFFVLMGAAMPSVLVETAFISNPEEERKLRDDAYRQRVAEALYVAISRFKARYERRLGMGGGGPTS